MKKSFVNYFLFIAFCILTSCQKKYENPLSVLKEEYIHSLNMYFYPSTIRMINLGDDPSFYKATKDIKSLHIMSVDLSNPENKIAFNNWEKEQPYRSWGEILTANVLGSQAVIYAPEEVDEVYFAKIQSEGTIYLLWAEGKINLPELMKVSQNGLDLGPINKYLGNRDKELKKKEIRRKTKEEFEKLELEDSLSTIN